MTDQQQDLMVSLNGDCLEHIFKMLPIGDRINMILSYQLFYDIFTKRLRIDFKSNLNTRFFNSLATFQLQVLLSIIGACIKHLNVEFPFEEQSYLMEFIYLKFLFTYCINVESLKYYEWSVNDESMKYLNSLKNLKSLAVVNNLEITGKYISDLRGLQELTLNNCTRIETFYFDKIFRNLKNLQLLDIRNCNNLSSQNFQTISQNLQELKTLKISTSQENFNCLAQLPNLKQLELWRANIISPPITKDFLQNLALYQAKQLEVLKLVDFSSFEAEKAALVAQLENLKILHCISNPCDDAILNQFSRLQNLQELDIHNSYFISNQLVLEFLANCRQVKRLNLRSCGLLTADLIPDVLYLLKQQRQLPNDRLQKVLKAFTFSGKIVEIDLDDSLDVFKFSYKYLSPDYECLTQVIEIVK